LHYDGSCNCNRGIGAADSSSAGANMPMPLIPDMAVFQRKLATLGRQSGRIHERDRAIRVCCKSFGRIFYSASRLSRCDAVHRLSIRFAGKLKILRLIECSPSASTAIPARWRKVSPGDRPSIISEIGGRIIGALSRIDDESYCRPIAGCAVNLIAFVGSDDLEPFWQPFDFRCR